MQNFFAEKLWVAFAVHFFFSKKISEYCILNPLKQLTKWPLTSSLSWRRLEQLGPGVWMSLDASLVKILVKKKNVQPIPNTILFALEDVVGGGGGGRGAGYWLPKACIERRKPRQGESMRGGFPSYKGVRGSPRPPPPHGKFLKLDCLRVHFHAIFESFSLILQADFISFSVNFRRSRVRKLLG